jgi:small-conductance mechanosensitive channel
MSQKQTGKRPAPPSDDGLISKQTEQEIRIRQLDFLTKHFLVLSAFLLGISAALSMLFLSAYLAVFDWTLIWLIEYADLAKLFLLGAALMLAMLVASSSYIQNFMVWKGLSGRAKIVFGVLFAAFLAWTQLQPIYGDLRKGLYFPEYHVYRAFTVLLFTYVVFGSRFIRANWQNLKKNEIMADLLFATISIAIFGLTFGYYVRDESYDKREIFTKDMSYPDARVVLSLSHHMAFLSHDKIIILPTSDITKTVTQQPPKT